MKQPRLSIIAPAIIALAVFNGGCRSGLHRGPIPGWVGIPANLLAPNSLEAEAYRNYRRQRLHPPVETGPVSVRVLSVEDSEGGAEASPASDNGTQEGAESPSAP
jgi:hypothetical protein